MVILEAENVWFKYPGCENYVLKGVSIRVEEGRSYFITGENGSGKTTLLLILGGLLKPEIGEVKFEGKPIYDDISRFRREVGILFQNPEIMLFNPTVGEEVSYALRQINPDPKIVRDRVVEAIKSVGLPLRILDRQTFKLSYGEKKLVALASIISYSPKILLLDEPYTNLSSKYCSIVDRIVREHVGRGGSAVIVGHPHGDILETSDYKLRLEDGVLVEWKII